MVMEAPFARIERMVDAGVLGHLANAIATVAGRDVPVIFDEPAAHLFDGQVDARAPECSGAVADLGALTRGDSITVRGTVYEVMRTDSDGAGFVRLILGSA